MWYLDWTLQDSVQVRRLECSLARGVMSEISVSSLVKEANLSRILAGREVDLIIERSNGRWALVEVKLGSRSETVGKAAQSLYAFKTQLDLSRFEFEPELIVITGGDPSYRHPDGINVIAFPALTA